MNAQRRFTQYVTIVLTLPTLSILCGCNTPQQATARPQTVAEIDAEIKKVQDNTQMPPQAKGAVLGNLQKARDAAAKTGAGKK